MTDATSTSPRGRTDASAVLLLPWKLEGSFLREQVEDLLHEAGVVAIEPGRLPLGSLGRLPRILASLLAPLAARRVAVPPNARLLVIFHPWQFPLARALVSRHPGCELWFSRWDRYEEAFTEGYHANPRLRDRVLLLQQQARETSTLVFTASTKLAALEEEEVGPATALVPLSADSFPSLDSGDMTIATSFGHLGRRTDWSLLRSLAEHMPNLVVLLIGTCTDKENSGDADYVTCKTLPNFVWLGYRSDEEAARLIACADVAIVPYKVDPYNDAALPHRILKCARLGRYSICPDIAGAATWDRAVVRATDLDAWISALRAHSGARSQPDAELREWALAQTVRRYNEPIRRRLALLGMSV